MFVLGVVELLLSGNAEETIRATIPNAAHPNLGIVLSNNIRDGVHNKVQSRPDRAFLLRRKRACPCIVGNHHRDAGALSA